MPESTDSDLPVRVALRARPLITKELTEGCQLCLTFVSNEPQVILGKDKAFTYDYVFDPQIDQSIVYEKAVAPLVEGIFKGYNATVLAYGQTGSGKTYTMGSGYTEAQAENSALVGVIPRVINTLFKTLEQHEDTEFTLRVSYLEVYNEEINDLLSKKKESLAVREDVDGSIRVQGLEERQVNSVAEMVRCLENGSEGRTTGSTAMNLQSSRSHAIFTIHIDQRKKDDSNDFLRAKFHLVDLAGSERAKRTQAQGDRFREGVNINKGLLALGNVISALGDENGRKSHVPYRDAKLTRLLQDSLGGNSQTVMIACVSPSDSNMEETLNTLRYADRARQIKNKPIVNRDPVQAELLRLRQQVQHLLVQNGGMVTTAASPGNAQDMKVLLERNKTLEAENQKLSSELQVAVDQTTHMCEKAILLEMARDKLKQKLEDIKESLGPNMEMLISLENEVDNEEVREKLKTVKELQQKIACLEEDDKSTQSGDEMNTEEDMDTSGDNGENVVMDNEHLLRRAEMNRQLQDLNKALQMKQELASKMSHNDDRMMSMKIQYETSMNQLETEISSLQKEKDELAKALVEAKCNTAGNKVSEQRRKRLQELEGQIGQLRKKLVEHGKLLKLKEQSDQRVSKLNVEIKTMKQTRVRLMKQMKEDASRFQQFKAKKDREVMQLKEKDRKRQFELTKLSRKNELQQNMLKRKAEEVTAANKRLKEAMLKQKAASDKREESFAQSDMQGVGQRVRNWLGSELEVLVSMGEARHHLQSLLSDRKVISQQLAELQCDGEPPKKKALNATFTCEDDEEDGDGEDEEKKQKISSLKQELQLRSAQIADLQHRVMDADQGEKAKHRWSNIRSIVEAKCGLKWLFNSLVDCKVQQSVKDSEFKDSESAQKEARQELEDMKNELLQYRLQHQQEITELQAGHEGKVLYLLKELQGHGSNSPRDSDNTTVIKLKERLKFQESQIADLNDVHEQLQEKTQEVEVLKKQLAVAHYQGKKMSLLPTLAESSNVVKQTKVRFPATLKPKNRKEALADIFESEEEDSFLDDSGSDWDDNDSDSSWCETPIKRKRSQLLRRKPNLSLPKGGCTCKGNCNKRCGCVKNSKGCSAATCRCDETKCSNRKENDSLEETMESNRSDISESQSEQSTILEAENTTDNSMGLNSTFVKSPDLEENSSEPTKKVLKDSNTATGKNTSQSKPTTKLKSQKSDSSVFKKPLSHPLWNAPMTKRPRADITSNSGIITKKKRLLNSAETSYFKSPVIKD
ncbi:chromosome-associated kinesin KIF4-like [Glandiceps talaboti]